MRTSTGRSLARRLLAGCLALALGSCGEDGRTVHVRVGGMVRAAGIT